MFPYNETREIARAWLEKNCPPPLNTELDLNVVENLAQLIVDQRHDAVNHLIFLMEHA